MEKSIKRVEGIKYPPTHPSPSYPSHFSPRTVSRRKKIHYPRTLLLKTGISNKQKKKSRVGTKKKENRFRSAIPAPLGRRSQSLSLFLFHRGGTWGLRRVCSQPNGDSPMQKTDPITCPDRTKRERERKARFVIRTQGEEKNNNNQCD